ncbi:MAG: hypothetical protein Q4A56_02305 [Porphyromonadaceae bacterium]|nr:hypothetical protein [Porphyromonadaceae bacterium]
MEADATANILLLSYRDIYDRAIKNRPEISSLFLFLTALRLLLQGVGFGLKLISTNRYYALILCSKATIASL